MKILIVSPKLNHGGAERVAVCLANGFAGSGHEVTVISNLREEITYSLDNDVKVCQLVGKSKNTVLKWLSSILLLRKQIKTNRPDVIIGIMQLCSFVARMASLGTRVPVIMTEHDSFERPPSAPFTRVQRFCKFYLNKIYTHVTVLTSADKALANKTLKHVTVMPNPLAIPTVNESRIDDVVNKKKNVVLASGRLYDWHYKGLDVLIRAWGAVLNSQSHISSSTAEHSKFKDSFSSDDWMLEIAGYGDEKDVAFLKEIAKECGVENRIRFLGFCTDVVSLYERSKIFVLSSRYEGFGLVLIEAMSQGCACVVCDYKGRQKEIIKGSPILTSPQMERGMDVCENGILCEPDNVEILANSIKKMMIDDRYRRRVQKAAIERSKFYDMEHSVHRWEYFLNEVVNKTLR